MKTGARRVTVFAGDLGPRAVGRWRGSVRLHSLLECLLGLGLEVEVVGFGPAEGLGGLRSRLVAIHAEPRRPAPACFPDLLRAARAATGDLLMAHKLRPLSFGVARIARSRRRRPLVLDVDDDEIQFARTSRHLRSFFDRQGAWRQLEHRWIFRWLERRIKDVDLITAASTELARRYGGHLLRTAKDMDAFDPRRFDGRQERHRLGLDTDRHILLFAGAPRPYKGLEDLLGALEKWPADDCPFHLVVLGGSPYDDYHDHLQQSWPDLVTICPPVPPDQVPAYLAAADLVVVPQRETPVTRCQLPLKLLDALAMAKPVLVTRVGDLPEITEGFGYLAEPGDVDSLRRQLEDFLKSLEEARQRGEAGRQRASRDFGLETVSRRLGDLLAEWVRVGDGEEAAGA